MPTPTPRASEDEAEFMSRCMGDETMRGDYPEQEQRAAVCGTQWRERERALAETVTKTIAGPAPNGDPLEYVMSDATVDRMGDVLEPAGWQLDNFNKNPIALFGHQSGFPIGKWRDVAVKDGRLIGRLELVGAVSDRMREIHAAVAAGVLRAVSVGFHPKKYEPRKGADGLRFTEHELVECSLVSVPANPNALALVRALGISPQGRHLIFGVPADHDQAPSRRGLSGVPAGQVPRKQHPMNISERIENAQTSLVSLREQLAITEADDLDKMTDLTGKIDQVQSQLQVWERAEKALGSGSEPIIVPPSRPAGTALAAPRPWATPKKQLKGGELVIRSLTAAVIAHMGKRAVSDVLRDHYGDDETRILSDAIVTRAATVPATTTLAGWAAELVQTSIADFISSLMPAAVYPRLSGYGVKFTFGRNGVVSFPARAATPTIAGSFIAEGAAIPVRQAGFSAIQLTPKKMGVISTFTRQIAEHSTPAIEQLIRDAMQEDTSVAIDTLLIDATVASAIRPAGILAGVSVTTATAGGGFAALVGDIKNLVGVLVAANSLRQPVWVMNPAQAMSASMTQNAGGDFPFAGDLGNGMLAGYPVIASTTVPAGRVILLDAADFVSVTGDEPRFSVSDQASLHMEDSVPTALSTPGSPNVVAAPIRSLWQTDTIGIRMLLDINWILRRTGIVAYTTGVTW